MEALKKNMVFFVGLAILLVVGVYWLFTQSGDEEQRDAGIIEKPSQYAVVRAEILGAIATLQAIRLDISVLDDPAFQSLQALPRPLEGQPFPLKKRNPFLP